MGGTLWDFCALVFVVGVYVGCRVGREGGIMNVYKSQVEPCLFFFLFFLIALVIGQD